MPPICETAQQLVLGTKRGVRFTLTAAACSLARPAALAGPPAAGAAAFAALLRMSELTIDNRSSPRRVVPSRSGLDLSRGRRRRDVLVLVPVLFSCVRWLVREHANHHDKILPSAKVSFWTLEESKMPDLSPTWPFHHPVCARGECTATHETRS